MEDPSKVVIVDWLEVVNSEFRIYKDCGSDKNKEMGDDIEGARKKAPEAGPFQPDVRREMEDPNPVIPVIETDGRGDQNVEVETEGVEVIGGGQGSSQDAKKVVVKSCDPMVWIEAGGKKFKVQEGVALNLKKPKMVLQRLKCRTGEPNSVVRETSSVKTPENVKMDRPSSVRPKSENRDKKGKADGNLPAKHAEERKQMGQKRADKDQRKKTRRIVMTPREEKKKEPLPYIAHIWKVLSSIQPYDKFEESEESEEEEQPAKLVKARKQMRQNGAVGKGQRKVAGKVTKTPAKRMVESEANKEDQAESTTQDSDSAPIPIHSGIVKGRVAKSPAQDKQLVWRETNGMKYKVREGITLKVVKIVLKKCQHNSHGSGTSLRKTPKKRRRSALLSSMNRFQCSECRKRFTRRSNLKQHLSIHTGERPWGCAVCGKAFNQNRTLRAHQQRIHSNVKQSSGRDVRQKPSRTVSNPSGRGRKKIHVDSFRFKCSYCSKGFRFNCFLKAHLNTHTRERSFDCTQCSKAYARYSSLYNHLKTHSNIRAHKCTCGKDFKTKGSLRQHERQIHDKVKNHK